MVVLMSSKLRSPVLLKKNYNILTNLLLNKKRKKEEKGTVSIFLEIVKSFLSTILI